jgi:hypothetical protein
MRLPKGWLTGFPACTMSTVTDGAWCRARCWQSLRF